MYSTMLPITGLPLLTYALVGTCLMAVGWWTKRKNDKS